MNTIFITDGKWTLEYDPQYIDNIFMISENSGMSAYHGATVRGGTDNSWKIYNTNDILVMDIPGARNDPAVREQVSIWMWQHRNTQSWSK